MAHLSIHLLGPFQVSVAQEPVSAFVSDKVRALLAYLVMSPDRPHRREALAGLLWPDFPERAARSSLRNALAKLRQVTGDGATSPPFLHITRKTIQFNGQSDYWLDAATFESLIAAVPPTSERLEQAVKLAQGLFLEGFSLADAAPFEEWLLLRRDHLRRQEVKALDSLAAIYEERGAYEQALAHARRRVELEPWQESGQRQLMHLLARSGHGSEALVQYKELCRSLREELDAEPAAETRALCMAIRSGELGHEPALRPSPPVPVWNVPASPTPLFGRVDELEALETWLAEPNTRLVTLTGLGGSGKTRLALETGARFAERDHRALTDGSPLTFPHGIVFVPLAALDSVDDLVPALVGALKLRLEGGPEQMLELLRPKQLLLILDNLEQLLTGVGFLAKIVGAAPGVTIMATSRDRLQVQGEHVLALEGLPYPEHDLGHSLPKDFDLDAYLATYPALQLLAEGVQRIRPGLLPSSAELPVMVEICRLVDGLPLALELAASWADTLSLSDILGETQRSLDFLQVDWSDIPERQRSIRGVFDASWQRLNPAEQAAFSALSVFRGSFSREAAEQVVAGGEATPRLLAALVRKSFLQYDQAEARYHIQELLCQYGAEKLTHEPVRQVELRDRHSAYYTRSLQQWETDLKGPHQQAALSEMEADRENIRCAWNWAAEQGQVERLDRAMEGLAHFFWVRGPYRHGENAFSLAANLLAATAKQLSPVSIRGSALPARSAGAGSSAEGIRVLARALAWQSNFSRLRGRKDLAGELQMQSLDLLEGPSLARHDTRREKALLFSIMGHTVHMSDHDQGRHCYERSLELFQELGDRWWMAQALDSLGTATCFMGSDGEARRLLEESLAIFQTLGHPPSVARLLAKLAGVSLRQGQLKEAERLAREGSVRSRELRDQLGLAYSLLTWGLSLEKVARFADAHSAVEECLAIYNELGNPHYIVSAHAALSSIKLHLGRYDQARAQAGTALVLARKAGTRFRIGHTLLLLGCVALTEEAYDEAQQFLQESITIYREIEESADLGLAIAVAGYAARGLGQAALVQQHLCKALQLLAEIRTLEPYLYALPAAALSLAEQGETERAVELYALASRFPLVAKSRWFADVAGNTLAEVAATLPAERVAVLRESGRTRDLATTAVELIAELSK